jgi:arylsulfatase A-like enzyme
LPGDALVYRFTDHAGEAKREGPPLGPSWRALNHPAKLPSPYSGLRGEAALGVVELALADAAFGAVKLDPVWNRFRAIYQSKTSLFAPAGTRWSFTVPPATHLRASFAAPTQGLEFAVEVDGREKLRRSVAAGAWVDIELPVERAREIAFVTRGPSGAAGFVGDPLLFTRDAGAPGPNLLLVIVDTLRADALPVMPRLSALAARGARFDQAITAATWTRPSLLAMLGGDLATAVGQSAEQMIPADADRRRFYAAAPPLLPRILEQRGWQADAIGNNFFLLGYPQIGLSLGFETVADVRHPVLDTPAIARAAAAFFTAHARESWYLQVHFDGPHWPYTPPPEYLRKIALPPGFPDDTMARAYLAEAAYADDHLGRLLDTLDAAHLADRTLVVVVGDHGEIFDHAHDHTVEVMGQPALHHHGWSAYDEILRVPLVLAMPGRIAPRAIAEQVSLVDLQPTVLSLLGLGDSARSLLVGAGERPAFVEGQNVRALRAGGWLYLRRSDGRLRLPDGKRARIDEELYDLARDPQQHHDLAASQPARLAQMRTAFAKLAPAPPEPTPAVVHLRLAPDERTHLVEGTLRSEGTVALRALIGAEVIPLDAHAVRVRMRGSAEIDLAIDPPDGRLALELTRDGTPLAPSQLLVGPFALPLLTDQSATVLDGERMAWLDAPRPPELGHSGDLLLWRDPSRLASVPAVEAHANDEVAGMMQRWGYAQPNQK